MRPWFAPASAIAVAALAACQGTGGGASLAPVQALPLPRTPAWIASISPTKPAQTLAQIRVIFTKPVTTVGALEGNGPIDVLSHFRIEPALRGNFVVLTPHMIGFVPEQALPIGTRVRVTLTAGLRDLSGDALQRDLAWTFETAPLAFTDLPALGPDENGETPAPANLHPTLQVTANAQVDARSLSQHATLTGGGAHVALDATLEATPTPIPGSGATEAFDPSLSTWVYDLVPRGSLQKDTTYRLVISPGIAPQYGNVSTTAAFAGAIRTYASLGIVATPTPSPGTFGERFARGDPAIAFNNPLDPKSLAANVTLSPAPRTTASPASIGQDTPNVVSIDPYLLAPRSTYTLTIGAGLTDVFGQQLGTSQTVTIRTGDFTPGLWAPSGTNVFPSVDNLALNVFATNLPGDRYRSAFLRLAPPMLVNGDEASALLPDASHWPQRTIADARPNVQSTVEIPLRQLLGGASGALAYGVSVQIASGDTITDVGLVSLTNLGVFAQIFPSRAIVRVARLSDGAPVQGASVALYRTGEHPSTAPCAGTTTGADGSAEVTGDPLQACFVGSASYAGEAPAIMAVASLGADWAYARLDSWAGTMNIEGDTSWDSGAPLSRGTLFTDRQMYQPGESARITGIAYAVRSGVLAADRDTSYAMTLTDPNGATRSLGSVRTDAFGVLSLPLEFGANQAPGYYGIAAKGADGNEIDGGLRVAQFKPPNFKLDVSFDRQSAQTGSSVNTTARASYLFGAPLAGAAAKIDVTRDVAALAPPGWDDFSFGRQWFWPEQQPEFDTDVLSTTGTFDRTGTLVQSVPVAADLPFPMTYSVDVQATDVSNLSVDTTQSFTALASDGIIGLKTDLVGRAGQPIGVQVVVTDLAGKPISGRAVHVELQSMTYTAATQLLAGGQTAQNGVEYTTVDTADITPGSAPGTVRLHPKDPGPYRIRANFAGARNDGSESDLQAFVVGAGEVDWGGQDNTIVNVKLDKKHYKVGETATALVASPFAQSDIYFAVVRQDVLVSRLVHATGNGPTISFRVTPAMLPNAAVEAVVVRRGPSIRTLRPGTLDSLARAGFAPLHVDLASQYLKIAIAPQHARLEPGARQSVSLRVLDSAGRPASGGEAVAMVVDDAILQLTGYRPPDLVQTIFADQPISTRYADNRGNVQLQPVRALMEKGFGYGGGYLAGAGSTRVRETFRPLAYYAVVRLDGSGRANFSFTLPDELTTWRTMVVAIGADDLHFGNADAPFIATKTLLTNPLLPQFARPGDTIDAGLSVLDIAGGGTLRLTARLSGALSFTSGNPQTLAQTSSIGGEIQALRFPMIVGTPAPTTLLFSSQVGSASDAFRVPFVVKDRAVNESVVEAGATAANASVPVDFSSGGTVHLTLANSVVPQFALPAADAMAADPAPFLDDAASRLVIAAATAALAPRYHLTPAFDARAAQRSALVAIFALQQSDGGFALFKGIASDPFESGYAVEALAFARDRGLAIDPHALDAAKAYLARTLENPARYSWCKDVACRARLRLQMLLALDALGDRRNDFLADIISQNATFDPATQIRLARYLLRVPGYHAQGVALADSLEQIVYRTGRYANISISDPWGWLGSPVEGQAEMLRLLVERGASPEETDGAVRALVAQQCGCGWGSLTSTASAVEALAQYAAHERLVAFHASVLAGTHTLASASFGTTASSQTIAVPASSIEARQLTFRSSGGTLHYALLYSYPVRSDAPGQLAALRVIRTVQAVGESAPLISMDLAPISQPVSIDAGGLYDIGVRVIVDHPVDRLMIEDPLPAGFEAVDAALRTSSTAVTAQADSWQIEDQQIYADRVTGYADHLEPGIYEMHYLARAVTPGSFRWPGARVYLRDAPEEFGRSAFAVLEVH
ncbi:MAG TPA: Ig-like domain-containing protein [Candidatus Tyrphobacter sp.]